MLYNLEIHFKNRCDIFLSLYSNTIKNVFELFKVTFLILKICLLSVKASWNFNVYKQLINLNIYNCKLMICFKLIINYSITN